VAVHGAPVVAGQGQFGHHIRIGEDHAGIVHHFSQGHDARMIHEGCQIHGAQPGTGSLHIRGRHAGRQREQAVHGLALSRSEHVVNARGAQHVGNLMGIGHHRGGAAGATARANSETQVMELSM
jgi:hypothetical protein